jgi:PelA/Pel-15E family pectate lyase
MSMRRTLPVGFAFVLVLMLVGSWPSRATSAEHFPWQRYAKQPNAWFESAEAKVIAANVLSHQSALGSWPKNLDTGAKPLQGNPKDLHGTFDNDATIGELRFLARMVQVTQGPSYLEAFHKGLAHIFQAQYPTGGWPQFYPPGDKYHRYITFNDHCLVNILEFLRDVAGAADFRFVKPPDRETATQAFDRGIACILKCQILVNGDLTAWCQQHDEKTLEARGGRTFEPVAITGGESARIVRLLMSLDKPSPEVVKAVHAACRWYERSKITGIRAVKRDGDLVIVSDPKAPPLWARYYEIGTNRPIFCGRDGVVKYDVAQIEAERRNGYAWLGSWPQILLAKDYPAWKAKFGTNGQPPTAPEAK